MREVIVEILVVSYGATAVLNIVAYWPTIKDLYINKKRSANTASYVLWSISTGIAFLYSLFILPDFLFRVVSGIFFILNALVLLFCLRLKKN